MLALDLGWRVCFFMGAVLGLGVLLVRRHLPESPRWLFTHGKADEADRIVDDIERQVRDSTGRELDDPGEAIKVIQRPPVGFLEVARVVFGGYPRRSVLGLSLFVGQAFLYNAVFFTYSLVLTTFYHVPSASVGYYLIAFALGNLLGPLLLGRLFDVVGRRPMIAGNILRDIDEDAAIGRLYLPREALRDAGIISTDPATVLANPMLGEACNAVVALAKGEFEQARAIMAQSPRRAVRAPRLMAEAYRLILEQLIARGFAPPRAPVHLPRAKFFLLVLRNLF